MSKQSLLQRLRIRAQIRRFITTRKSYAEGKPDRIADLLDEAANEIERLEVMVALMRSMLPNESLGEQQ